MPYRLGDELDDYCSRCRRLTNNAVEAMVGEEVVKVRCRTCNSSHDYKHGQVPEKVTPRKTSQKSAFDAVLASVIAGKTVAPPSPEEERAKKLSKRAAKPATHHGLHTLSAARRKKTP